MRMQSYKQEDFSFNPCEAEYIKKMNSFLPLIWILLNKLWQVTLIKPQLLFV